MPKRFTIVLLATAALAAFPVSCAKQQEEKPGKSAGTESARPASEGRAEPAAAPAAARPAAARTGGGCGEGHAHHGHGGSRAHETKLPESGHLGAAFAVKKTSDLAKVLADPKAHVGKKIRVSGRVVAQCIHRRAWFAIAAKGKTPWLRVITAPRFLIHSTAKGMNAEAEGTLVFRQVTEAVAKHLAKGHGLFGGKPDAIKGPQNMPILLATGAKFTK
jgi:hypothetical protein